MLRYLISLFIMTLLAYAQEPVYVKYYRNDTEFLKGQTLLATERFNQAHIRVAFNERDQMLWKEWFDKTGEIEKEETYEYTEDGSLWKRAFHDGKRNILRLEVYDDYEEMSKVFIQYAFPHRNLKEFNGRKTIYEFGDSGEIEAYRFFSVDNTGFGVVYYQYDPSGLVSEERWITLPGKETVRLFQYEFHPTTHQYELFEYDSTGTEISHVGVTLPVESTNLFAGKTVMFDNKVDGQEFFFGNVLEEVSEILEDIRRQKIEGVEFGDRPGIVLWEAVKDSPDVIYLKNGDVLKVILVDITKEYVRFKLKGEDAILHLPITTVGEIERRDGEILYPIIYPNFK